jgi:hypothetical protein
LFGPSCCAFLKLPSPGPSIRIPGPGKQCLPLFCLGGSL